MSDIVERNTYFDYSDGKGNIARHFPFTKYDNIEDMPNATKEKAAPVKLYTDTGDSEDGALSQKASTEKMKKIQAALQLLSANSYIIDDMDGKTYKIGSENGKFYCIESNVSVKEIVDMIVTATESLAE